MADLTTKTIQSTPSNRDIEDLSIPTLPSMVILNKAYVERAERNLGDFLTLQFMVGTEAGRYKQIYLCYKSAILEKLEEEGHVEQPFTPLVRALVKSGEERLNIYREVINKTAESQNSQYWIAMKGAFQLGCDEKILEKIRSEVNRGVVGAMSVIAEIYITMPDLFEFFGFKSLEEQKREGLSCAKRAATGGDLEALRLYALMSSEPLKKRVDCAQKAGEQGFLYAQLSASDLISANFSAYGISHKEGIKEVWLRNIDAAYLGIPKAQGNIAAAYRHFSDAELEAGNKVTGKEYLLLAKYWSEKAALGGYPAGWKFLGNIYSEHGHIFGKSFKDAEKCYLQAIRGGDKSAKGAQLGAIFKKSLNLNGMKLMLDVDDKDGKHQLIDPMNPPAPLTKKEEKQLKKKQEKKAKKAAQKAQPPVAQKPKVEVAVFKKGKKSKKPIAELVAKAPDKEREKEKEPIVDPLVEKMDREAKERALEEKARMDEKMAAEARLGRHKKKEEERAEKRKSMLIGHDSDSSPTSSTNTTPTGTPRNRSASSALMSTAAHTGLRTQRTFSPSMLAQMGQNVPGSPGIVGATARGLGRAHAVVSRFIGKSPEKAARDHARKNPKLINKDAFKELLASCATQDEWEVIWGDIEILRSEWPRVTSGRLSFKKLDGDLKKVRQIYAGSNKSHRVHVTELEPGKLVLLNVYRKTTNGMPQSVRDFTKNEARKYRKEAK